MSTTKASRAPIVARKSAFRPRHSPPGTSAVTRGHRFSERAAVQANGGAQIIRSGAGRLHQGSLVLNSQMWAGDGVIAARAGDLTGSFQAGRCLVVSVAGGQASITSDVQPAVPGNADITAAHGRRLRRAARREAILWLPVSSGPWRCSTSDASVGRWSCTVRGAQGNVLGVADILRSRAAPDRIAGRRFGPVSSEPLARRCGFRALGGQRDRGMG